MFLFVDKIVEYRMFEKNESSILKIGLDLIEKFFGPSKPYQNLILETRHWKVVKYFWSREQVLFYKILEIQAKSSSRIS